MSEEPVQPEMESEEPQLQAEAETEEPAVETVVTDHTAAASVKVERDAVVNDSGVLAVAVGRDAQMTNSLVAGPLAVGRDLSTEQSVSGMVVVGNSATVQGNSVVGVLVSSGPVTLTEGSRVLMSTQQAAAFGAALGAVFALLSFLFRRRR